MQRKVMAWLINIEWQRREWKDVWPNLSVGTDEAMVSSWAQI